MLSSAFLDVDALEDDELRREHPRHTPMEVPALNAAPDGTPWSQLTLAQRDERFYRHRQKKWCVICVSQISRFCWPGVQFCHGSNANVRCSHCLCFDCAELWDRPFCPKCEDTPGQQETSHTVWLMWPTGDCRRMPYPEGTHADSVLPAGPAYRFVCPPGRWSPVAR